MPRQSSSSSKFPAAHAFIETLEGRTLFSVSAFPLISAAGIPGGVGLTPAQVANAYNFNDIAFGKTSGNGAGTTIAIVDAYNDPNISADVNSFDKAAFGSSFAKASTFLTIENENGKSKKPAADSTGGWELEESLDVEWAHAMAPGAKILLIEANSSSLNDLLKAVDTAANTPGVVAVSMSWGTSEFSSEVSYDYHFVHPGVTFIASAGDSGSPAIWPAVSPNVVAVGGTYLSVDSSGNYLDESTWNDGRSGSTYEATGGGISEYESLPSYQAGLPNSSSGKRLTPDVAYDADPNSGFAVYDSYRYNSRMLGWVEVGGTSAGAPQWASIIAIADQGRKLQGQSALSGSSQTLPAIYAAYHSTAGTSTPIFHDITTGNNGTYSASIGYDLVTGVGSPYADRLVDSLLDA